MKNRVHDAPVKMIQILPVDNHSSHQPLKPADFSFLKRIVQAFRETITKATEFGRRQDPTPAEALHETAVPDQAPAPREEESREPQAAGPAVEQCEHPVRADQPALPVQRSDTIGPSAFSHGWDDRAPDIVVSDIVAIQDSSVPDEPPALESSAADASTSDPQDPQEVQRRFETMRMRIAGQWRREKEQIASARTAVLAAWRPRVEAVRRSLLEARVAILHRWGTIMHAMTRRGRQIDRRLRKMAAHSAAAADRRGAHAGGNQSAAREVTHELEVTKATLLAQQQALENVTVQLNAVQKELARHKSMLAGLMTQVEAVDLKIARAIHPPGARKPKSTMEGAQKRVPAKMPALAVEREQRV